MSVVTLIVDRNVVAYRQILAVSFLEVVLMNHLQR